MHVTFPELFSITVTSVVPYPSSRIESSWEVERWRWLTLSLKRGQQWNDFGGELRAPDVEIINRLPATSLARLGSRVLVPVPRSQIAPSNTWPSMRLCTEIQRRTGCAIIPALSRRVALESSSRSSARGGGRNTIRAHHDSLDLDPSMLPGRSTPITFVDDTLTSGTQLAAVSQFVEWEDADVEYFTGAYVCDFDGKSAPRFGVTSDVTWIARSDYAHAEQR